MSFVVFSALIRGFSGLERRSVPQSQRGTTDSAWVLTPGTLRLQLRALKHSTCCRLLMPRGVRKRGRFLTILLLKSETMSVVDVGPETDAVTFFLHVFFSPIDLAPLQHLQPGGPGVIQRGTLVFGCRQGHGLLREGRQQRSFGK
jgi:hypothetical protein